MTKTWLITGCSEGGIGAAIACAALQPGDQNKAAKVLLQVGQSENPPFRLLLSKQAVDFARKEYQERLAEIDAWQSLSETTDFD